MDMKFRLRVQLDEAYGEDNQYFCSQHYGRCITDKAVLLEYFIRNGGAEDFADRYDEALSPQNRWFCSEHFGREVNDDMTLWTYYVKHAAAICAGQCEEGATVSSSARG